MQALAQSQHETILQSQRSVQLNTIVCTIQIIAETKNKRNWRTIDGNPPPAIPKCGFQNERCSNRTTSIKLELESNF